MEKSFDELNEQQKTKAIEAGWSGLFATPSRSDAVSNLEYARAQGDDQGIMIAMVCLQNRNIVDGVVK